MQALKALFVLFFQIFNVFVTRLERQDGAFRGGIRQGQGGDVKSFSINFDDGPRAFDSVDNNHGVFSPEVVHRLLRPATVLAPMPYTFCRSEQLENGPF